MKRHRLLAILLCWLCCLLIFPAFAGPTAHAAAAAPKGLKASVLGSSSVKLSWSVVSGAKKYEVYMGTSTSSMALAASGTAASCTLTALSPSTTYYFKVRAVSSAGSPWAFSAIVSTKTTAGMPAPAGVKAASVSSTQVQITWNAVTGAKSYTVYRSTSAAGTYKKIASVAARSYSNTGLAANTAYYYKIRAVDGKGEGVYSSAASARTRTWAPSGLKAMALSISSIRLTWSAVSGATKYCVYRSTTSTGTYYKIGEAAASGNPSYTSTGLAEGKPYYYRVSAVNAGGLSTQSVAAHARTLARPAAPTGLKATALSVSSIKLTWGAVSGATKYCIYRSATSTGTYTKIAEVASSTAPNYTNTGLAEGATCYYRVSAINTGGASAQSAAASAATLKRPAAPTGLKATALSVSSIKLTWNAVSGATKYCIYRSATSTGTYTKIAEVASSAAPNYTNTGLAEGATCYYKVSAVNAGGESAQSAAASAATLKRPAAPTGLKATALSVSSIKLTWGAVSGATKYCIYRSATSTGTYTKIAEVASSTAPNYTNTGLAEGATCYYKVSAVNAGGESAQSAAASAATLKRPATPIGLKATALSASSIKLTWSAVSGATKYYIYRSVTGTGTYTKISEVASSTTPNYTNTGLAEGAICYYKVSAINAGGESAQSAYAYTKTLVRPTTPTGLNATAQSVSSIQLTWTAVSGATKYIVYRSASADGSYTKVAETTATTFTDTGLPAATVYYYKVSAANAGGESPLSSSVSALTPVHSFSGITPNTLRVVIDGDVHNAQGYQADGEYYFAPDAIRALLGTADTSRPFLIDGKFRYSLADTARALNMSYEHDTVLDALYLWPQWLLDGESEDSELQRAANNGFGSTPSDSSITYSAFFAMLDQLVQRADASKLTDWQTKLQAARSSQQAMDRDEGMLAIFFAAEALGIDQYNTQWWLYNEKIGDRWNEMKFNYPLLEGWSAKKTVGGTEWSDYMVAAYFYSFGRESAENNKIIFDYDAASNSMRTNDPFTVREAMLAVLRLHESITGSTPSVPVQEIGTYDKRIITSALLQRGGKLPAPTTEQLPYYAGMNYFRSNPGENVYSEDEFRNIAQWGFNYVRLTLTYLDFFDKDVTTADLSELRKLDQVVSWGLKYGLHISVQFSDFPGHVSNYDRQNQTHTPDVDYYTNAAKQEKTKALWTAIAKRYKGIPSNTLSFIMNHEPRNSARTTDTPVPPYTDEDIERVSKDMIAAISAVDPERFQFFGNAYDDRPVTDYMTDAGVGQVAGYAPDRFIYWNLITDYENSAGYLPDWPFYAIPDVITDSRPLRVDGFLPAGTRFDIELKSGQSGATFQAKSSGTVCTRSRSPTVRYR